MLKPLITAIALGSVLGGCATIRDSAVNPFNWFGRSSQAPVEQTEVTNPLIPTQSGLFARARERRETVAPTTPIDQITALQIERVPGGAIIRATGVDATQGTFNAGLVPANADETPQDGVLVYTFERQRPAGARAGGSQASREVTVARHVTDQNLRGVRSIRVVAASNARVARR